MPRSRRKHGRIHETRNLKNNIIIDHSTEELLYIFYFLLSLPSRTVITIVAIQLSSVIRINVTERSLGSRHNHLQVFSSILDWPSSEDAKFAQSDSALAGEWRNGIPSNNRWLGFHHDRLLLLLLMSNGMRQKTTRK